MQFYLCIFSPDLRKLLKKFSEGTPFYVIVRCINYTTKSPILTEKDFQNHITH